MRQQILGQQPGRRGEQVDRVLDGVPQAFGCESRGRDRIAQQVAMLEQELLITLRNRGFAVVHGNELWICAEASGHATRQPGAGRGVGAFDR